MGRVSIWRVNVMPTWFAGNKKQGREIVDELRTATDEAMEKVAKETDDVLDDGAKATDNVKDAAAQETDIRGHAAQVAERLIHDELDRIGGGVATQLKPNKATGAAAKVVDDGVESGAKAVDETTEAGTKVTDKATEEATKTVDEGAEAGAKGR